MWFFAPEKKLFTPFVRRKTGRTVARFPARQEQHVLASTKNEVMRDISTTQKTVFTATANILERTFPAFDIARCGAKVAKRKAMRKFGTEKIGCKKRPLLDFAGVLKITFTLFAQNH